MFVVEVRTRLAFKEKEKEAAEPVLVDVPEAASRSWNLALSQCRHQCVDVGLANFAG